jgi:hypothetical protein
MMIYYKLFLNYNFYEKSIQLRSRMKVKLISVFVNKTTFLIIEINN